MVQITAGKFASRDPVNKGTEQENKNPVREPGNVVVEEAGMRPFISVIRRA